MRAAKIDNNQKEIVAGLRKCGFSVECGHDDILVGTHKRTYWFELKNRPNAPLTESEVNRLKTWRGQYNVVSSIDEILEIMK